MQIDKGFRLADQSEESLMILLTRYQTALFFLESRTEWEPTKKVLCLRTLTKLFKIAIESKYGRFLDLFHAKSPHGVKRWWLR